MMATTRKRIEHPEDLEVGHCYVAWFGSKGVAGYFRGMTSLGRGKELLLVFELGRDMPDKSIPWRDITSVEWVG